MFRESCASKTHVMILTATHRVD